MARSNDEFRNKFLEQIRRYIYLRRMHDFLILTFSKGTGKYVENDILYEMQRLAWDGLFIRLKNYTDSLIEFLREVRAKHLKELPRNRTEAIREQVNSTLLGRPHDEAHRLFKILAPSQARSAFISAYDDFFPGVKARKAGFPNNDDIEVLIKNLIEARRAIKQHRDTMVAHEDKAQKLISIDELKQTLEYLEKFLREFYFVATNKKPNLKLIGGSNVESTSDLMVKVTLKSEQCNQQLGP